jgi:hypothetical protein
MFPGLASHRRLRARRKRQGNGRATYKTEKIPTPHVRPNLSTGHRISSSEGFDKD